MRVRREELVRGLTLMQEAKSNEIKRVYSEKQKVELEKLSVIELKSFEDTQNLIMNSRCYDLMSEVLELHEDLNKELVLIKEKMILDQENDALTKGKEKIATLISKIERTEACKSAAKERLHAAE